jgi:hypothetical protein
MVTICLSKKMKYLATARSLLVGYLAVATVLSILSADRFNNLRNVTAHRGNVSRVGQPITHSLPHKPAANGLRTPSTP